MLKPTTAYFNAEAGIAELEAKTGQKASELTAFVMRTVEPVINQAYVDGYNAALEDMARK